MNLEELSVARIEVTTPKFTLQQVFADYESGLKKALYAHMDDLVIKGEINRIAIAEFNRMLPVMCQKVIQNVFSTGSVSGLLEVWLENIMRAELRSMKKRKAR